MDPESKQLLQNTLTLTEENNALLHKIRGVQRRGVIFQVLKWIIILGIAFGSFYFVEPYLNKIMDFYSSISGIEQKINNNPVQDFFKKL